MKDHLFPQRFFWLAAGIGLILFFSASLIFLWIQFHVPYKGYNSKELEFRIARGSKVAEIARQLRSAGVIPSEILFRLYLRLEGDEKTLKAGEYLFEQPLSMTEVINILHEGRIRYYSVTVPEGLDMKEIAEIFVSAGFGSREKFEETFRDTDLIRHLDPVAENLEGYLFPETYYLTSDLSASEITGMMVEGFLDFWSPRHEKRAKELELTTRDSVTLASLIEKETALMEERALVSAVFHNRLDLNMRLGCDPTVIYAVKQVKPYDGVINRSDLALDSPYNTYLYPGLPPGPIANPGRASLNAALNPAESDYLYFVSRNDGSHVFSKTSREHNRAVQLYQR